MNRCALGILLMMTTSGVSALEARDYPHLMDFEEAFATYQAGDLEVARPAFRHLAELGFPEARFNLGVMLAKGQGGERDMAEALAWVRWAAEEGDEAAVAALPVFEKAAGSDGRDEAGELLASLKAAHALESLRTAERGEDSGCTRMERPPPEWPEEKVGTFDQALLDVHLLLRPDGNVGAVQAIQAVNEAFVAAAVEAVRRWRVVECPPQRDRLATQKFEFLTHPAAGGPYTGRARRWAANLVKSGHEGDADKAYLAATLADSYPELMRIDDAERWQLMHEAAVGGVAAARFQLSAWLSGVADDHSLRWELLAAMQGYPPALVAAERRTDLLAPEAKTAALVQAAETGYLPGVVLAADRLATHPDQARRDGARALALVESVEQDILAADPAVAEAYAAALAETGNLDAAVKWQETALSKATEYGWNLESLEARLARYRAGAPWRQPQEGEFTAQAGSR